MRQYKAPLFQQRHYEWLARVISRELVRSREANDPASHLVDAFVMALSHEFAKDNPKYKPSKFNSAVYG